MDKLKQFMEKHKHVEKDFAKQMGWEYKENQKKGSCFDFTSPDGAKIEAKFDWDSAVTGNHYLEFAQTSDGGQNWAPSGFSLSADATDYWAVVNKNYIRIYQVQKLKNWVKQNRADFKITISRGGKNNNTVGLHSKAYLIPYEKLDQICFMKKKFYSTHTLESSDEDIV